MTATEENAKTPEILRFCFGEAMLGVEAVLVTAWVRQQDGERIHVGARDALVLSLDTLDSLAANIPTILAKLAEESARLDVLSVPDRLPAWNDGPTLKSTGGRVFVCSSVTVTAVLPDVAAMVTEISAVAAEEGAEEFFGEHVVSHRVWAELQEAIPKVVRKIAQRSGARRH